MLPHLDVSKQPQTVIKRIVLCFGLICVSFLAIAGFGFFQRVHAAENTLPTRKLSAATTSIQPKLVANYGKLPLSFEANQGQTDARVRFLARGGGYTIFLTDNEAVLTLRKSTPAMGRSGKFGSPRRDNPFGPIDSRTGRWPSLADGLNSWWRSLIPDLSPMVPDSNADKGGVAGALESRPPQVVRMRLEGGHAKGRVVGLDELPGRSNYFIGNDPKKWRTNVASYAKVKYEGVYPGVDLVYYGNQRQLEYDFVVAPGADPNQIKLSFAGAEGMRVDAASGDLVLNVGGDEVRFHKPVVYQPTVAAVSDLRTHGPKASSTSEKWSPELQIPNPGAFSGAFVLASSNEVAFRVAGYDPKRALVIDPVLSYATLLGGAIRDGGNAIAVDATGNAYVTGETQSSNFPITTGAPPTNLTGTDDAFVTKLNAAGSALVYSTFLGGSGFESGYGIAVDATGNAYVTGSTYSSDFPITPGAFQTSRGGSYDGFVTKVNGDGSALVYSTYLGGSADEDEAYGIAVNASGNAYVTGETYSSDFPTTPGAFQTSFGGTRDPFVTKLNADGSALVYSTFVGKSSGASAFAIALDATGNAYVTGETHAADFPTTPGAFKTSLGGSTSYDSFVTKVNAAGSALVYSTYLGGSSNDDSGYGIAVDTTGNIYVTGHTESSDFPTTPGAIQTSLRGAQDAFVTKLNAAGSALVYSTYLGGSSDFDWGKGIAVDATGNAYATGYTRSSNFPTTPGAFQTSLGGTEAAYVTWLNVAGSALVYSTYLGSNDSGSGIAVDTTGDVYVAGSTQTSNFPTTPGAFQETSTDACAHYPPGYIPFTSVYSNDGKILVGQMTYADFQNLSLLPLPFIFPPQNFCEEPVQLAPGVFQTASVLTAPERMGDFSVLLPSVVLINPSTGQPFPGNVIPPNLLPSPSGPGIMAWPVGGGSDIPGGDAFVAKFSGVPGVTLSTHSLGFGSQMVSTTSAEQSVTLTSNGDGTLRISTITASGDFTLVTTAGSCPYSGGSVAALATCTIDVAFMPTATGTRTGTVTINDSVTGSPQTVSLTGTGVAPVASLSAPSLNFTNQLVGTKSAAQPITLSNTGDAALIISGIAASANFGQTNDCGTSVAASGSCTISVTFSPAATGTLAGTLTITDNSNGLVAGTQTVSLSGTGALPVVSLSAPLTFSAQLVGTTSSSQTVTLTNTGNGSLTFTAIALTGPFAIATTGTTCSTSSPVAAAATCTVAVTFKPTAAGTSAGSLSFTDNAPNSPQTLALSGTGQDFTIAPPSGSSTTSTVVRGQPATYTLSVGGQGGLTGTVTFICTGAPSGANCTVSPNPATAGSTATNVTVTVTTTAATFSAPRSRPLPPVPPLSPGLRGLWMLALVLAAMAWAVMRRNQPGTRRWQSAMLLLASGLLLSLAMTGCGGGGGGGGGGTTHDPGTPVGTYPLTVTGTTGSGSSTLSHSVTLTLNVN